MNAARVTHDNTDTGPSSGHERNESLMQMKHVARAAVGAVLVAAMALAGGCGASNSNSGATDSNGKIEILAAENEYGDVAQSDRRLARLGDLDHQRSERRSARLRSQAFGR
jgi:hypothetical protein